MSATEPITSDNISKLTTYQLRQELVRRNAFDLDEDAVNYNTLLKRLLVEVLKDEEKLVQEKEQLRLKLLAEQKAEALRIRELKKQEALERSQQRMQSKDYFANKEKINSECKIDKTLRLQTDSTSNNAEDIGSSDKVTVVMEQSDPEIEIDDNPFRSKQRFKVAVK